MLFRLYAYGYIQKSTWPESWCLSDLYFEQVNAGRSACNIKKYRSKLRTFHNHRRESEYSPILSIYFSLIEVKLKVNLLWLKPISDLKWNWLNIWEKCRFVVSAQCLTLSYSVFKISKSYLKLNIVFINEQYIPCSQFPDTIQSVYTVLPVINYFPLSIHVTPKASWYSIIFSWNCFLSFLYYSTKVTFRAKTIYVIYNEMNHAKSIWIPLVNMEALLKDLLVKNHSFSWGWFPDNYNFNIFK